MQGQANFEKSKTVNFQSRIPYYVQLLEILRAHIDDGLWKPGMLIPSEKSIGERYQISRTTVRQALRELELEGLIYKRKGKGSIVTKPKISEGLIQKLTGFHHDMVERGLTPVTKVLEQIEIPCPEKVANFLEIESGKTVTKISRLRSINNEPIQLVTTYIPSDLCPELINSDLTDRSLYEYLEDTYHIIITRGKRFLEAVLASSSEAKLLEIDPKSPLLMLESVTYDQYGTVIEYYHALHRGDRSRFEVELVRGEES